jgi:hypothetical protein
LPTGQQSFEEWKGALRMERKQAEEQVATPTEALPTRLAKFLELAGDAYSLYKKALPQEKRDLLRPITSNRLANCKNVEITLAVPFGHVASRPRIPYGAPYRGGPRTLDALLMSLTTWFKANPRVSFATTSTDSDDHTKRRFFHKEGDCAT